MIKSCSTCGKKIKISPSRTKEYSKNYCSRECQHKGMFKKVKKICQTCKKEFYVEKSRSKTAKYCSFQCANKDKNGLFIKGHIGLNKGEKLVPYFVITCLFCKKKFEVKKSGLLKKKFCSKKCQYCYRIGKSWGKHTEKDKKKIGKAISKYWSKAGPEKHPRWIDGRSYKGYGKWFKPLREQIRERDKRMCQLCCLLENGEKLAVHHIDYDKSNYKENNLISLCRLCHARTNVDRDFWRIFFQNKMEVLYGFTY